MKVRITKNRDLYETGLPEYSVEVLYEYSGWTVVAAAYNVKLANKIKKLIEKENNNE